MKLEPKQTNCEICHKPFLQYQMPRVCSIRCAAERKRRKEALKPAKIGLKPIYKMPKQKTDFLQVTLNKIAKLIDAESLCPIMLTGRNIRAGHVHSIGANSNMRYNLHNIHRQSKISNYTHNDDIAFREALAGEYGNEYIEFVESCRKTPVISLTESERKEKELLAREWLLRLQSKPQHYKFYERIQLRSDINEKLGIYPKEFCVYE